MGDQEQIARKRAVKSIKEMGGGDIRFADDVVISKANGEIWKEPWDSEKAKQELKGEFTTPSELTKISEEEAIELLAEDMKEKSSEVPNQVVIELSQIEEIKGKELKRFKIVDIVFEGGVMCLQGDGGVNFITD